MKEIFYILGTIFFINALWLSGSILYIIGIWIAIVLIYIIISSLWYILDMVWEWLEYINDKLSKFDDIVSKKIGFNILELIFSTVLYTIPVSFAYLIIFSRNQSILWYFTFYIVVSLIIYSVYNIYKNMGNGIKKEKKIINKKRAKY